MKCQLSLKQQVTDLQGAHTNTKGQLCSLKGWLAFTVRTSFLTNFLGNESDLKSIFKVCFGSRKNSEKSEWANVFLSLQLASKLLCFIEDKSMTSLPCSAPRSINQPFYMSGKMGFVCGLCICIFREFYFGNGGKENEEVYEKAQAVSLRAEKRLKETQHPKGTCVSRLEITGAIDSTWAL